MPSFTPNRSLLNPKFEGYRLDPIAQEDAVTRHDLQFKLSQATVSAKSPLSMQEVQSRITHNHLAVASSDGSANGGGRALYVDAELRVIVVDVDLVALCPSFRIAYELSKPIQTSAVSSHHPEYPSAVFLSFDTAFVSDGHGCLYILSVPKAGPARLCGTYELCNATTNQPMPFRIHNATEFSSNSVVAILSSRFYAVHADPSEPQAKSQRKAAQVKFDVWAAQFSSLLGQSQDETPRPMDILWHKRGEHVPISTMYDSSQRAHLLIGGSVYRSVGVPAPPSYEPTEDEFAPIPRSGENLDMVENRPTKPPPYSWTQTNDEVTLAFSLPSSTDKSHIKVSFSSRTLTVHVQADDRPPSSETASVPLFPHYSMKQLWDSIQPSTSFWTWDRKAEHSYGLLTLHMDKQNDGTRWMPVFASAGTSFNPQDDTDVEVPETLDPSELYKIRESLEKYTSSLRDGEDASGLGLGKGVPSLGQGEIDDEVDTAIGRQAYLTWVPADNPSTFGLDADDEVPFSLLSTTVPGIKSSEISLVVKNSFDGVVFSLPPSSPPPWTHISTFPALAFVLASKQDTRFTYHVPSKAVLAFENGTRDRGGNVYIYRSSAREETWAKQAILKVGDGQGGSLLGVGAMKTSNARYALLCLCEEELVVIDVQNIL